jgi:hypothetical protein
MFGLFLFFYLFLAVFRKATDSAHLFLKLNDKTFALFQGGLLYERQVRDGIPPSPGG